MVKTNRKNHGGEEYRVKLKRFSRDIAPALADFDKLDSKNVNTILNNKGYTWRTESNTKIADYGTLTTDIRESKGNPGPVDW